MENKPHYISVRVAVFDIPRYLNRFWDEGYAYVNAITLSDIDVILIFELISLPSPTASRSRTEGQRGDERTPDGRSEREEK